MTQKEVAINAMKSLNILPDYIKRFKNDGVITLFERFGGFYIDEHNEPELLEKIREFEKEYECIVYAVTHNLFIFGECYSFLCISKYEEEWAMTLGNLEMGLAWSYVWNKTDEWCSEFGTIAVRSIGGGIMRIA